MIMRVISCNVCGRKHTSAGAQCEDKVCVVQKNGVVCAAVADGAGSRKYTNAAHGAQAVSEAIASFFCEKFDEYFAAVNEIELRKVISAICHKALGEQAHKLSLESAETMASTLLCVAVKRNKVIACQIGDGVIGCIMNGTPETLTLPQNGEFAGTTFFVNAPDSYKYIQVRKGFTNSVSHIFLMTDGISESVYDENDGTFHEDINRLVNCSEKENGSELLEETVKKFIVDTSSASDDCTMAVINFEKSDKYFVPGCALATPHKEEKREEETDAPVTQGDKKKFHIKSFRLRFPRSFNR